MYNAYNPHIRDHKMSPPEQPSPRPTKTKNLTGFNALVKTKESTVAFTERGGQRIQCYDDRLEM